MKNYYHVQQATLNNSVGFDLETTDGIVTGVHITPCDETHRDAACQAADNRTIRSFLGKEFVPTEQDEDVTCEEVSAHYQSIQSPSWVKL